MGTVYRKAVLVTTYIGLATPMEDMGLELASMHHNFYEQLLENFADENLLKALSPIIRRLFHSLDICSCGKSTMPLPC